MEVIAVCRQCGNTFSCNDVRWVEWRYYSEKVATCPFCGAVTVLQYEDAPGLDVNNDKKYYDYRRKRK